MVPYIRSMEGAIRSLHVSEPKAQASRSDEPKASRDSGVSERLQRSPDRAALAHGFQESPNRAPTIRKRFHFEKLYSWAHGAHA
jgi:hypothetical protein